MKLPFVSAILVAGLVTGCTDATQLPAGVTTKSAAPAVANADEASAIEFGVPKIKSVTPTVFNVSGAPTVEFTVPDMMCEEGCAATVKEILTKQPGVKDVVVDFDAKTATVAIEEGAFDAESALAALVDKQFDHSSIKNAAESAAAAGDSSDGAAAAATPPAAVN